MRNLPVNPPRLSVKAKQLSKMEKQLRAAFTSLAEIHKGKREAKSISQIMKSIRQGEQIRVRQRKKFKKELKSAFKDIDEVRKGRRKSLTMADVLNQI